MTEQDWEALCLRYSLEKAEKKVKTAREFCDLNAVNYFTFSRKFAKASRQINPQIKRAIIREVRSELEAEQLSRTRAILTNSAPQAARTLIDGLDAEKPIVVDKSVDMYPDPSAQTRSATAILDRVGISAPVAAVNMQQHQQQAIIVPALFESSEEASHKRIFDNEADLYPPTKELPE